MAFTWPARVPYKTRELISQVLWTLKLDFDGKVEDKGDAVKKLRYAMERHGVEIENEMRFRMLFPAMEGGKYGDLIVRTVNGRRTQCLELLTEEMPANYLPDAPGLDDEVADDGETFSHQSLFDGPAVAAAPPALALAHPAPAPAPVATVRSAPPAPADEFDQIIAGLQAEMDELRRPLEAVPPVPVLERVGNAYDLDRPDDLLRAILALTSELAVKVAGRPNATDTASEQNERLAEAVERAERFRRRALDAEETAVATRREAEGLSKQIAGKDGLIARLEANVKALMRGEPAAGVGLRNVERFIAERPHDRRGTGGDSHLVYSTGG